VAHHKFGGFQDYRGGGHFSGRLTVAVVAAGVVAKKLIQPVEITAQLTEVGGSCDISASVRAALRDKDSIGGLIECRAKQVPVGLGEPFFDSLESLLGHLIFAIPGIKGIEFGAGFQAARMRGSEHNDLWINHQGQTRTNHAGGINGGISNGNDLFFRVAVKPTASIERPQQTIDLVTQEIKDLQITGRHDACFALRIPVIVEAATALVLADLLLIEQKIPKIVR
jgi:chorismate synthase